MHQSVKSANKLWHGQHLMTRTFFGSTLMTSTGGAGSGENAATSASLC
jgi:hypothetical protein